MCKWRLWEEMKESLPVTDNRERAQHFSLGERSAERLHTFTAFNLKFSCCWVQSFHMLKLKAYTCETFSWSFKHAAIQEFPIEKHHNGQPYPKHLFKSYKFPTHSGWTPHISEIYFRILIHPTAHAHIVPRHLHTSDTLYTFDAPLMFLISSELQKVVFFFSRLRLKRPKTFVTKNINLRLIFLLR